jgi:DNA mismatch endonuclease (patch repair protein)
MKITSVMADVHSKEIRSYNMSQIKGKNTKPEMLVRRFLHANGFRYRLHVKDLPGRPDIVLPRYKTLIFVHGCFWHGHEGCKYFVVPKTKTEWWLNKINGNIANNKKAVKELRISSWKIIILWECDLKPGKILKTLPALIKKIRQHDWSEN